MKIVLDTNILLVSFSKKSSFYTIWESLLLGKYTLCVTTDILLEYEYLSLLWNKTKKRLFEHVSQKGVFYLIAKGDLTAKRSDI
jgi:predicted nucleic acid-binding protein